MSNRTDQYSSLPIWVDSTVPKGDIYFISPRKKVFINGVEYWDETEEEWMKRCAVLYNIGLPDLK